MEDNLRKLDQHYQLVSTSNDPKTASADIMYAEDVYGELEINIPGDRIFDEEIKELKEFLEESNEKNRKKILEALEKAKAIIAVRILWRGRETEENIEKINQLIDILFKTCSGILQVDGEGYYDVNELILSID